MVVVVLSESELGSVAVVAAVVIVARYSAVPHVEAMGGAR